jgi:predicted NBD/HSP70 family sugar kinase
VSKRCAAPKGCRYGTAFIEQVTRLLEVTTIIANDSNLALVGELQYILLPDAEPTVLLSMGTGPGCAIWLNGRILVGEAGLLGEFGRLRLPGGMHRLRDLLSGADLVA